MACELAVTASFYLARDSQSQAVWMYNHPPRVLTYIH